MNRNMKFVAKFFYATLTLFVATLSPAFANMTDAGEETGPGMTALETILWFVVTPTVVWLIIWFLWSIPKWRRNNEPKTGENWNPKPSSDVVNQ
jgi:hypothetical protein